MDFQQRAIAWIDILGFSAALEAGCEGAHLLPALLKQRHVQMEVSRSMRHPQVSPVNSMWLSDTLVMTAEPHHADMIARRSIELYREIISTEVCLARGSLSLGTVYDRSSYVFGPGLIKAERLEKSVAIPAVLVDPGIRTRLKTIQTSGVTVLDPFHEAEAGFHEKWRAAWQRGQREHAFPATLGAIQVQAKYNWMASYQAFFEAALTPSGA